MPNTQNINLEEVSMPIDTTPNNTWVTEWKTKINANNVKIDDAVANKVDKSYVDNLVADIMLSEIPDGSVTKPKLSSDIQNELNDILLLNESNFVVYEDSELGTPVGINADTLGGQLPNYYASSLSLEQKADIKKTITRQTNKAISGTLLDFIKTQINNGNGYGSLLCRQGTDMDGLSGFVTWKSDNAGSLTVHVDLDSIYGKKFWRTFYLGNNDWLQDEWQEIATTDKIDILSTDLLNGWTQTFPSVKTTVARCGNSVNLTGWLTVGNFTTNTIIFNIPYRPSELRIISVACSDGKNRQLGINTAGDVAVDGTFILWESSLYILLDSSFII